MGGTALTTIYLDALEGGRVEEKYVEDGTMMKKGQPILRLSNTDLLMSLVNQENSVYQSCLRRCRSSRNAAQQNTVGKLNQMTDVESQLKEAERIYNLNKKLYEQKAIGRRNLNSQKIIIIIRCKRKKLARQILKAGFYFYQTAT